MAALTLGEKPSNSSAEGSQVTHKGVTYFLANNLPPLKFHVAMCPRCDGSGQMYGRKCRDCKGLGRLFSPVEQAGP